MHVETKFLRLFRAVELGDDIDGLARVLAGRLG